MLLANLDLAINIIEGHLLARSFNSIFIINEYDICMSSINYEENGYEDVLD
jgi:hypothetical protein